MTSCAARPPYPDVRIADAELHDPPRRTSRDEALADLDRALYVFGRAYAGVEATSHLPAAESIEAARAAIRSRSEWSPEDLAALLIDLLRRPDAHLAVGFDGPSPRRLLAIPTPYSKAAAAPLPALELSGGEIPVLTLRSLDNAAEVSMRRLPELARTLRRSPSFVVDLRGNTGGNPSFAQAFVAELTNAELRLLDEREVVSLVAAEGRANAVRRRLASGEVPSGAARHFETQLARLEALIEDLRAEPSARSEVVTVGAHLRGRATASLASRGVFLVDRGCASACEMLVALARQVPGVIIAGSRTRGGMAVGEVGIFRLPRSGILLWLGTRAFRDPFGDFEETRGFAPDVWIDDADPLEQAKRIASGARDAKSRLARSTPEHDRVEEPR